MEDKSRDIVFVTNNELSYEFTNGKSTDLLKIRYSYQFYSLIRRFVAIFAIRNDNPQILPNHLANLTVSIATPTCQNILIYCTTASSIGTF